MPNGALTPRDGYTLSIHQFLGSPATGSVACDSCSWSEPFAVPGKGDELIGAAVTQAISDYATHPHRGSVIGSDMEAKK